MARRKESGIDLIAALPWPLGMVLGVIAFLTVRYGIGWYLTDSRSPVFAAMGKQLSQGAFAWLAWALLVIFWIGALVSFIKRRHRGRLLDTQSGLASVSAMSWREFEMLVGEAFRRHGYAIEETGLGGADGGIDLLLRKQGAVTLVQCKQWRKQRVDVRTVREMYGLMAHHGAQAVKIVCVGDFTPSARRFAEGKCIELIHGENLLEMIRCVQSSPATSIPPSQQSTPLRATILTTTPTSAPAIPECPRCEAVMVQRSNRRTGEHFWGCSAFPTCRGMRPMHEETQR